MDTLEIPKFELMNYLPYFLIEEALEFKPTDLAQSPEGKSRRKESRIEHYTINKQNPHQGKLTSIMETCDLEEEVSSEINKILHASLLYEAFFGTMMLSQTESKLKNNLQESVNNENRHPNFN